MTNCVYITSDESAITPSVYETRYRKAKKVHVCSECGSPIVPGDYYEKTFGVWKKEAKVFKTCTSCINAHMVFGTDYRWDHGCLWEYIYEAISCAFWGDDLPLPQLDELEPPAREKLILFIDSLLAHD